LPAPSNRAAACIVVEFFEVIGLFGFSPEGGEPEAPESRWDRVDSRKNQMRLILIDDCRVMIVDF